MNNSSASDQAVIIITQMPHLAPVYCVSTTAYYGTLIMSTKVQHTHDHFMALLDFVRDYLVEPAPERLKQSGFTGARDSEWQWHQLGHMQICTLTKTHNCASIPPLMNMV